MTRIRTLIVDDSATMRSLIKACLEKDPDIEVVGTACDPYEAREAIKSLNPDVVTLDIEMPKMDGISFLEKIMRLRPTPVIMVSTLTHKGAAASIQALSIGAFDCFGKPDPRQGPEGFAKLRALVKAAAASKVYKTRPTNESPSDVISITPNQNVIAIGASTGGVDALLKIISRFPKNCPPTVITQHMPEHFTHTFASRLDRMSAAKVLEATDGAPLEMGTIYLAPGGQQHLEIARKSRLICRLNNDGPVNGHRPSVDVLFDSVTQTCGKNAVGMILTGMGRDGAMGLKRMRDAGAQTYGQDEASCVVYGMPRAALEVGAVEKQFGIHELAGAALRACDKAGERNAA